MYLECFYHAGCLINSLKLSIEDNIFKVLQILLTSYFCFSKYLSLLHNNNFQKYKVIQLHNKI